MAYVDPYTGQVIGGGLMSPYTTYGDPYSAAIGELPTQADVVAQQFPSQYGDDSQQGGLMGAPRAGGQMSPQAQQRAMDALAARGQSMALGAGKRALAAGVQGADFGQALRSGVQGAVTPTGIMSLATSPMYAAYGVKPETTFGKAVQYGTQALSGLMGPVGGVVGAVASTPFASAVEDALGMRPAEADRDVIESAKGFFGGRQEVADRLSGTTDTMGTLKDAKTFNQAANRAIDKLGLGISRAKQKQAWADVKAYQDLADLAASLQGVGSISNTTRSYGFPTAPIAGKTYGTGYGNVAYGTSLSTGMPSPMSPRNALDARAMRAYDAAMAHERGERARSSWGGKGAAGKDASGRSRGTGHESEPKGSRGGFGGTGIGGR